MDDLLREFLTESSESLDTVDNQLVQFEQDPNNAKILDNIFRLVHTIKGTCGFLGLLHMEIVRERLEREANLDLISTAPNVIYRVVSDDGSEIVVTNPSEFPTQKVARIFEPIVKSTIILPSEFVGTVMELCQQRRGTLLGMDYLSEERVEMRYTLPLAEIVFDFFDALKSRTRGYASLDYELIGEQEADLVKVDILLHGDPVDAFSAIVHRDKAMSYGTMMTSKLKELIPRQQFKVPIQAAVGSRVIASEAIPALRKDVLAKWYVKLIKYASISYLIVV